MTPPTDAAVLGGITAESKEYFEKRERQRLSKTLFEKRPDAPGFSLPGLFGDDTTAKGQK